MNLDKDMEAMVLKKYAKMEHQHDQLKISDVADRLNPFYSVKDYCGKGLRDNGKRRSKGDIINIFDNSLNTFDTTSINDAKQELSEGVSSCLQSDFNTTCNKRSNENISQTTINLSTRTNTLFSTSCSKSVPKTSSYGHVRFTDQYQVNNTETFAKNDTCNKRAASNEKHTYCRPLHNMYNEEFVYKTIQRHARLQKIVRKLVVERQKEKQRESWNNYINELKNRHRYYSNEPTTISPQYVPNESIQPECIDDYWDTRESPESYQSLHKSFYVDYADRQTNDKKLISHPPTQQYFQPDLYCFPISSQGRLMILNKERERTNSRRSNFININRDFDRQRFDVNKIQTSSQKIISVANVQTETKQLFTQGIVTDKTKEEKENMYSSYDAIEKIARVKEQKLQTDDMTIKPLENIEKKLDILINSVHSVIIEMREKMAQCVDDKPQPISCALKDLSGLIINGTKNDPYRFHKMDEILLTTVQHNNPYTETGTSMPRLEDYSVSKIEKIIQEEMEKSEKIKNDIKELLQTKTVCNRQCSVQIEFDAPTRETSEPVSNTGSKEQGRVEEEIKFEELNRYMRSNDEGDINRLTTVAVNTDPLGLLALLRVSTETIKQLLSYMPNMNYNSYLSLLQLPRRPCVAHYMCNICGAAFSRPSQLSDHIQNHHLGRRRNCCECCHLFDARKDRIGLFDCRYCGQRFARSYCCELHQKDCAKRFGIEYDVKPNLMLLR